MNHNQIINILNQNGFQAYLVGGCVRDIILGNEPKDYDITTNAKYEQMQNIFSKIDCKIDLVGKAFNVLMIDDVEVASFRKDIYDSDLNLINTDNVKTIEEDLERRDLTINSMAMKEQSIIDPFNGQEDLNRKIIRFTGNAIQRILEDPIRMLRACRFLSSFEYFRFARNTFKAIKENARFIKNVPAERIQNEIMKAMKSKNAGNFFRALNNTGLLQYIFPDMMETVNHDGGAYHNESIFEHSCLVCDKIMIDKPILKLAAFLHDIGKPIAFNLYSNGSFKGHDKFGLELAENALKRLKFSNDEIEYVKNIISVHMYTFDIDSTENITRRFMNKCNNLGLEYQDVIAHIIADHDGNLKKVLHNQEAVFDALMLKIRTEQEKNNAFSIKDLTINGNDVMLALGLKPSKRVGDILEWCLGIVIETPSLNKQEILLELIKNTY